MLTRSEGVAVVSAHTVPNTNHSAETKPGGREKSRLARAASVEWLGQMAASLCWIASVFTYGITSAGDWLQLAAAGSWLIANIATIATAED